MALSFHPANNLAAQIERDFKRAEVTTTNKPGATLCREKARQPSVGIVERGTAFRVLADLPGVDPQTVDIELENNTLTQKCERVNQSEVESSKFSEWPERVSGKFVRRFSLPDTVDVEQISAKSEFGVMEIIIPQRADLGPRKITV